MCDDHSTQTSGLQALPLGKGIRCPLSLLLNLIPNITWKCAEGHSAVLPTAPRLPDPKFSHAAIVDHVCPFFVQNCAFNTTVVHVFHIFSRRRVHRRRHSWWFFGQACEIRADRLGQIYTIASSGALKPSKYSETPCRTSFTLHAAASREHTCDLWVPPSSLAERSVESSSKCGGLRCPCSILIRNSTIHMLRICRSSLSVKYECKLVSSLPHGSLLVCHARW